VTATRSRTLAVRRLGPADYEQLRRLVDSDPYVNVGVAARLNSVDAARLSIRSRSGHRARSGESDHRARSGDLGGDVFGIDGPDGLRAAWWRGATVAVVGGDCDLWAELAGHLGQRERGCASITGRAEMLSALWRSLSWYWGPARLVRAAQPLLVADTRPAVTPDAQVRPAQSEELDCYLPAAEAMFTEELGLPPFTGSARRAYRQRLSELISARRVFVRLDRQGRVAFKAEIGAVSGATSQIQGVWVRPDLRGRGLGTAAMATVLDYALRLAPTASLYVNDFNQPARRVYERLGMRQVATVSTVMF
jgi:predicted GNAT family acetyltransferase